MKRVSAFIAAGLLVSTAAVASQPARILTNQVGYEEFGPKQAIIQGSGDDNIVSCSVRTYPDQELVYQTQPSTAVHVDQWKDWRFWTIDFSEVERQGEYTIECTDAGRDQGSTLHSFPFRIQHNVLERHTLASVISYFRAERVTGALNRADSHIGFKDPTKAPIDASGGWYDATGDYGVHFSQLDYTSYFNTQQIPLVVFALGRSYELLAARGNVNFDQLERRLLTGATYGADFLVRMHPAGGSFYETINAPGREKAPDDRRIDPVMTAFSIKKNKSDEVMKSRSDIYQVSFRSGGGFAIASLAIAARLPRRGAFDNATYLQTAEEAFTFLQRNNKALANDGVENIIDDYSALLAASELYRTTQDPKYRAAAQQRAENLMARLTSDDHYKDYWRADNGDRPFFHPSDAGAPVVALLDYYPLADKATQARIKDAVHRSLKFELSITHEVANPFGLARQYVQSKSGRRSEFFFPHDTLTAPWWQGENARLASLSTAARLALPLFADNPEFSSKLKDYATDQLNWILGLNPYDASMLQGVGHNNPGYGWFSTWQYTNIPGGIVNGVTSGFLNDEGIDFNLPYSKTGKDADWRWGEQWLPHSSWYLLAVASRNVGATPAGDAVIGYVFAQNRLIDPDNIPAKKVTVINYAFANIKDGVIVKGFRNDARNFKRLNSLKKRNPELKVLVSVGGWTWSGNFSDMALTPASRQRFIDSAVAFVQRYHLDGLDIDWEYPGLPGMNNTHRPADKQNFTALLAELRTAFDRAGREDGKHYLLTIAAGASDRWLAHTEMDKVAASLDYINLMAYDQFVGGEGIAAHHAPLYTHPANPKHLSASTIVDHFIAAGVPAHKIVLGLPFYGRAWVTTSTDQHGLYQPGHPPATRIPTMYSDIAKLVGHDGYVRYWDDISAAPYLFNEKTHLFISYDSPRSIRLKCRYVAQRGLGGVMFWELHGDPQHVLLDTINAACGQTQIPH